MRVRMGMVQALVRPGTLMAAFISSASFSGVMPGRHSLLGFSMMVVSIIDSGAGSVAVSARPTLPNTFSTSGKVRIIRSVCCRSSPAFVTEMPGNVVGM